MAEKKTAAKKTEEKQEEQKQEVAVKNQDLAEVAGDYDLDGLDFEGMNLDDLSGIDSINTDDIRVPFGKIYAKAQDGRKPGDILLPDGTVYEGYKGQELTGLSILKIQPVRVYFPQPFKKTNTFICRSHDGKVAAPDGKFAGRLCSTCEFSEYPEDGGAPPCREQMLLLCTIPDGTLFYFLVGGISASEFKKSFMSVEMMKGLRLVKKKLRGKSILGALNLRLSTVEKDTEYGPFPQAIFKVDPDKPLVDGQRLKENLEAYSQYKDFEDEAVATATDFAQTEQGEHVEDEGEAEAAAGAEDNGDAF